MYEYISGNVSELTPSYIVLDNNGIGYFINISLTSYDELNGKKEAKLYIYQVLREDTNEFFGFTSKNEREIFKLLISVSGIGANTARLMLSSLKPKEIVTAILEKDVQKIKTIKGIGQKTAERVIVDLRDKVSKIEIGESLGSIFSQKNENLQEALSALVMLGFNKKNAEEQLNKILKISPDSTVEMLVKNGIKAMSGR